MTDIYIRTAIPSDAEAIMAVILPIQQNEFGITITLEAQPDLASIRDFYQTGAGNFWVAGADGKIVGTIGLLDIGERKAALRKMFVAAPYRGRQAGVAACLIEELLRWSRVKGVQRIYLGTTDKFLVRTGSTRNTGSK